MGLLKIIKKTKQKERERQKSSLNTAAPAESLITPSQSAPVDPMQI